MLAKIVVDQFSSTHVRGWTAFPEKFALGDGPGYAGFPLSRWSRQTSGRFAGRYRNYMALVHVVLPNGLVFLEVDDLLFVLFLGVFHANRDPQLVERMNSDI